MIVIVPFWLPLLDISEFSVFSASPLVDIAVIVPDSIVRESFPFIALLTAVTFKLKFLIHLDFVFV